MKAKNQLVILSGILVLLATATIAAANYVVQPAKAACDSSGNVAYGKGCVSQEANPNNNGGNTGQQGFGGAVSGLAQNGGLQGFRASGCGANQFPAAQGGHDVC